MMATLMLHLLVFSVKAEKDYIGREEEIAMARDHGAVPDIIRTILATNYTEISPWYIDHGDRKAFTEEHEMLKFFGHIEAGQHHIVAACGNVAVTWQRRLRRIGNDSINGTGFAVFEYTDGKAHVQFYHMAI